MVVVTYCKKRISVHTLHVHVMDARTRACLYAVVVVQPTTTTSVHAAHHLLVS